MPLEGTPPAGQLRVRVEAGPPLRFHVEADGAETRSYRLQSRDQSAFLDLLEAVARDFAMRAPHARRPAPSRDGPELRPLLTEPVSPKILYGYGDPCVVQVGARDWRLLVTSNDAPDAFPILASSDLKSWRLQGFVFPQGRTPAWTLTGDGIGDFWAPEMHRLGAEWIVCFTARLKDRTLAIGLARSASPDGPFVADPEPIVEGGVIDSHILVDAEGSPWLVWKRDDNGVWPRLIAALLHRRSELVGDLFGPPADRAAATFAAALWPWLSTEEPMVQFFGLQVLIEAAAEDLPAFELRLLALREHLQPPDRDQVDRAVAALRTRIYAQRLTPDARALVGEPVVILRNDLPWEGHLIEGVWISHQAGRYYLFYAGNDFSTAHYGVGLAVADAPTGPYRKSAQTLLASSEVWWGPGHPSVAPGPDGRPHIFLHAFRAGEAGYKAFRALLSAPLSFAGDQVSVSGPG